MFIYRNKLNYQNDNFRDGDENEDSDPLDKGENEKMSVNQNRNRHNGKDLDIGSRLGNMDFSSQMEDRTSIELGLLLTPFFL